MCGIISAVDGERNPRNLVLLFNWFPKFLKTVNLGHLTEETFEILACYFPVDFKAPTQDPNVRKICAIYHLSTVNVLLQPITRETLADSLAPCLTAIPQFAEFCFSLALEKLDSSLEIAKLDSLKLLVNFNNHIYHKLNDTFRKWGVSLLTTHLISNIRQKFGHRFKKNCLILPLLLWRLLVYQHW